MTFARPAGSQAVTAHLVLGESGRIALATAGMTTGWLTVWIRSAGAGQVHVHSLEGIDWQACRGWRIVLATEDELMRVAVAHGKHIGAGKDGARRVVGADPVELDNPPRFGWHYRQDGGKTLLLPIGDIAYQRDVWLSHVSASSPLEALQVVLMEQGGSLEPGLSGALEGDIPQPDGILLNDQGYLPEEQLLLVLRRHGLKLRCAESCTAGALAARVARVPGASDVLERGWVTYGNDAKVEELGVDPAVIEQFGAVSCETVMAMARGGMNDHAACIAVSGIAGPGGGTLAKPVGTVWMAVAVPGREAMPRRFHFVGSRADIQNRSVVYAMALLIHRLEDISLF